MGFDFDAHVRAMRAADAKEMIPELFRQLFALERWFFLDDPRRSGYPLLWQFGDGLNTTPCILAFTDDAKAMACARALVSLGGIPRVMPAPRKQAVPWMIGLVPPISWACFNFEGWSTLPELEQPSTVNFPLYLDDARRFEAAAP